MRILLLLSHTHNTFSMHATHDGLSNSTVSSRIISALCPSSLIVKIQLLVESATMATFKTSQKQMLFGFDELGKLRVRQTSNLNNILPFVLKTITCPLPGSATQSLLFLVLSIEIGDTR